MTGNVVGSKNIPYKLINKTEKAKKPRQLTPEDTSKPCLGRPSRKAVSQELLHFHKIVLWLMEILSNFTYLYPTSCFVMF